MAPKLWFILLFSTTGNGLVFHTVMINMLSNDGLYRVERWDRPILCYDCTIPGIENLVLNIQVNKKS